MIYNFCVILDKKQRVDMYLSALFNDFSRSYIQKIIDNGEVFVNGKEISKNLKISNKDEIKIILNIEKLNINPEDIELDIVYQDKNIAIINKNAGINTHPTPGLDGKSGTLVNALLYHIKDLSSIGGVERPGIVHRLDKDTSGLIMIAKNDEMMKYLQKLLKNKDNIGKYYLAIVKGIIKDNEIEIESYIGRDRYDRTRMTSKNPINPKIAKSIVKKIKIIDDKYSLVEVKILTGRTHQIRVHLSSLGYPIIGDKIYGDKSVNKEVEKTYGLRRQALHAYRLKLKLYQKDYEFIGEIKKDMLKIIN